jgi:RNA-directed DNA polymerase
MMKELEKSDPSTVAAKPANKTGRSDAESVEPREGAKGNTPESHTHRTQSRASVSPGLERVRERARQGKKERFRLGSMNKMITAVSVLQLVEQKKLRLDGTIREYWPDYPNQDVARKVTIRNLHNREGVHPGSFNSRNI